MALGDQKPSQLYHEMCRVAQNSVSDQLLLDLWAARLPVGVQHIVIANQGATAEKITIADAVLKATRWRPITAVEPVQSAPAHRVEASTRQETSTDVLCQITHGINLLQQDVSELKANSRRLSRSNSRDSQRSYIVDPALPASQIATCAGTMSNVHARI
uniref:Uncharacterized protein n=1 Tax=Anopheles triannulatus TaxID=58253 RepID=A0A2M4B031_9DIPT